jgi:hypothetical protein
MSWDTLAVSIPIVIALLAINFELIKESKWRRERTKEKERLAVLQLMDEIKARNVNPDVNEYYRKVQAGIRSRSKK